MQLPDRSVEIGYNKLEHGLTPVDPDHITDYLDKHFDSVKIRLAKRGSRVVVPEGWHGAGKTGDAIVTFGDVLTAPIAGTILSAEVFTEWLSDNGFELQVFGLPTSPEIAAHALKSAEFPSMLTDRGPLVRATRRASTGKIPIQIEYYAGSLSFPMRVLTAIGNRDSQALDDLAKTSYKGQVATLTHPFFAKGTTAVKEVLGISRDVTKVRRLDDCLAAGTTILGDMMVEEALGRKPDNLFEEIGVAVGTTQGAVIMIHMAEKRGVPLLVRIGAPSFGLASKEKGLNYMANTQPEALALGYFTTGDLGNIMGSPEDRERSPSVIARGNCCPKYETRLYYNGGGPMQRMMDKIYDETGKPFHGVVVVLRASRIDNGPEAWGLIESGIYQESVREVHDNV